MLKSENMQGLESVGGGVGLDQLAGEGEQCMTSWPGGRLGSLLSAFALEYLQVWGSNQM